MRLGEKLQPLVNEQLEILRLRGVSKGLADFVRAGVLELLLLDDDEQRRRVYGFDEALDEFILKRSKKKKR